ncbi:beta-ketoacyl synthase N-terminal-like domain-containing protein [Saccharothrix sp. Mg75]|uniref:beta-ketoacyl synthase N-terminal-like domain-containing protein n=1 Tax=Saccharothrix sp. Mg75 TaxID=3445357 RepID=UPI003EEECBCB
MAGEAQREPRGTDPVAIVGLACRLPGADGPSDFWRLLSEGRDAITDAPADRWRDAPVRVRRGGFLDDVAGFDAGFFRLTPREAASTDPQQRLVLELGWEALEHAGLVPAALRGTDVGVFIGATADDYARLTDRAGPDAVTPHTLAGLNRALLANRLSYLLGARGPSATVDTGQSSSLVAVHLAAQSVRSGESELAVAGGVQLNLAGTSTVAAERFGALSPDGRCRVFDARANGYVRGEGGAVVVLKPLARALADGDEVWAVLRGGAVNNDGGGAGLTTPDADAQRAVVTTAHAAAGIGPDQVQYVELHGTGTRVGDPVEARALGAAIGAHRPADRPLLVGSVKTNVGHLEGAAGVTGLLKVVLALHAGLLPASPGHEEPNPDIAFDEWRLRVHDRLSPWPRPDEPLIAGVSSFGMGGTNCHLVLAAAPGPRGAGTGDTAHPPALVGGPLAFPLSAPDDDGLRAQAARLADWVRERPDAAPADLAHSLAATRTAFTRRAVVVAGERGALLGRLDALAVDEPAAGLVTGSAGDGVLAALFTGQGAQRLGAGRELHAAHPVFAAAFDEVCAHLDPLLDRPLRDVAWGTSAEDLDDTAYAQPALFAVEVALHRLVTALGVRPALLLGHSVGELAAAHVAGVLTLPDAATLVVARGRLMGALPPGGAMAAVEATEDEVLTDLANLADLAGRVGVAAVNGPRAVVVSGDADAVDALVQRLRARGRRTRGLRVSHAFHSHRMDPVLDEFRAVARSLSYAEPAVPVVSNVTGRPARPGELTDPEYWVRHIRGTVRFGDGARRLAEAGVTAHLELGPDAVLAPAVRAAVPGDAFAAALRRDRPEPTALVEALATLHAAGVAVDLAALTGGHRVPLPTYAFRRRRHWLPDPADSSAPADPTAPAGELLPEQPRQSAEPQRPEPQRPEARRPDTLRLVRVHTAAVLGLDTAAGIVPDRSFRDLGVTSATGVELRDRLATALDRALPETLVYDHPTPAALAAHLAESGADDDPDDTTPGTPRAALDDDPVVIVGMACRFPGGVRAPEDLWRVVADGVDAIGPFPTDRGWDTDRLRDPDRPDATPVDEGGFLSGVTGFDAAFFGVNPREAAAMDPQQRLLLETSWEALERAGVDPASLRGTDTGVFVGTTYQEYGPRLGEPGQGSAGYRFTGTTPSVASGRIAYVLGLHGPAITLDTACSASLVAVHTASAALRSGECSLALAGGATVMPTPGVFAELGRLGGLSPRGRSRAFSADADGTGWAEGAGVLVLERLSDARRHGHPVLAVVRGSAVNSDGASNGLTAPNGAAQRQVIRRALAAARLSPADVDAVEAHGTGTRLGDPIEAAALIATYGQDRDTPLWLGSVKSNIGHTQAAAGVAGVIKVVQAMRHGVLPRSLHAAEPTPRVDWDAGAVRLLTAAVDWPRDPDRPRRAGVSSFGISGTNAHLLLEEPPPADPDEPAADVDGPVMWPLSAATPEALAAQADRLGEHLDAHPGLPAADVAWSLLHTRTPFPHRAVVTAGDRAALTALAGTAPTTAATGTATDPGGVVFVFPGHGSQWPGMVADLYAEEPAFAARLRECAAAVDPLVDWSLLDTALDRPGAADRETSDVAQPVLFAVMVSLAALWEAHGVRPSAVVGHSQGELAAACVAGALTLADAARVVVRRSRVYAELLTGRGTMAAVELSAADTRARIADRAARLEVAVVNGPLAVTVGGEPDEVDRFVAGCKEDGVRARVVVRAGASHCAIVEPLREPLLAALAGIAHHPPTVPFYSAITGSRLDELGDDHWFRNVREPVDFQAAVTALLADGHGAFVECAPHPVLAAAVLDTADATGYRPAVLATLRRGEGGRARFRRSLAEAHVRGVAVDWDVTLPGARRADLPTYPFQHRHHWLTAGSGTPDVSAAGLTPAGHPLLGAVVADLGGDRVELTGRVTANAPSWVADHAASGTALLPGTAFVELALRAGDEIGAPHLAELTVERPLPLPAGRPVLLRVVVERDGGAVAVHARPEDGSGPWTRHASGTLTAQPAPPDDEAGDWPPSGAEPVDVSGFYADRERDGYGYGPAFRGLRAAWRHGDEMCADVALDPSRHAEARGFTVHPALLDAALHAELLRAPAEPGVLRLPFAWTGVSVPAAGATALRVRVRPAGGEAVRLTATDDTGHVVAVVESLLFRPVRPADLTAGPTGGGALYGLDWRPPAAAAGSTPTGSTPVGSTPVGSTPVGSTAVAVLEPPSGAPAATVLAALQRHLADGRPEPLAVVTRGGVATRDAAEVTDTAHGAARGLVRSAQAEFPGRFLLLDADPSADPSTDADAVRRAVAALAAAGEDQGALRGGDLLVPRLTPVAGAAPPVLDPEGVVLVTGGTGALGGGLARHLVTRHGVRHLLLVSRRGPDAPGAAELCADLAEAGARATAVACDTADRAALAALLDGLDRPLTAVLHLAAAGDDAPLEELTADRLAAVLRPKVDGARHLDELTRDQPLRAFALFSSAVGVLGTPAQAAYAAANAHLDALAQRRRARGVPAVSLAWGLWDLDSGLGALDARDLARLSRAGLAPMSADDGWALLDSALGADRALLVPAALDLPALRERARRGDVPPLLRGLVRGPTRTAAGAGRAPGTGYAARLTALSAADRDRELLALVRGHAAAVLGHDPADTAAVDPERAFRESGLDSLTVVELRNRLGAATGLTLPATLLFDHPTPAALAARLRTLLLGGAEHVTATTRTRPTDDPIAVVALACRFPGGITGPEDLWRLVDEGGEAIGDFPADRGWDTAALFDPDPARRGRSATRRGGFLHDAGEFDADLFGINPREALAMDPQQRLLLETSWETWERAGIPLAEVRGSRTGVFLGVAYHDYAVRAAEVPEGVEGYLMTGSAGSVASGRVAYAFGLNGPALTVDTACSSSLVALHLAVQSLRRGESDLALAGGVSVMSTPTTFVEFSRQQGLAVDGRCKSYGEGADGTGWSEGVGVLLLERLSDARRNGHPVVGLVRGTAINQDGASNGLTAPSGLAQERVIREAWADAGTTASEVDFVEGHGTGTRLGDPIEAGALLATYGQDRDTPLWLGSVKSNIGHTQAAAGVAGIAKALQAMRHDRLPRTLHADTPTPEVDWSSGAVRLLREPVPWPRTAGRPRRAGVSSFGISGTNAHVIIEEAPEVESGPGVPRPVGVPVPVSVPVVLSAATPGGLRGQVTRLRAHLADHDLLDTAYSLATTRSPLPRRIAVAGRDTAEVLAALDTAVPEQAAARRLGFVFSGQGAQWAGMGTALGFAAEGDLDRTEFAQPALFGFEVALFHRLRSWGVRPDVVAGHSIGEIAAAHVAGVLDLDDAWALVRARGRLMQALPPGGAMVAVEAGEDLVRPLLRDGVSVAAVNGPRAVVLSGPEDAVTAVLAGLNGYRHKRLAVSHAFHSALVEPMLDDYRRVVSGLVLREPVLPLVSGLTGRLVGPGEVTDPEYWVRQVREPVRFADAVTATAADLLVEIGPDAVLAPVVTDRPVVVLDRRGGDEAALLTAGVARLAALGVPVDWEAFFDGTGARRVDLPTYAFDHRHYWIADGASPVLRPDPPAEPVPPVDLAALADADLLDVVCAQTAAVLGRGDAEVDPHRAFRELGFDSLTAVELRNRLVTLSGLDLPPTLVFDHPTPDALAEHLRDRLRPDDTSLEELFALVDGELGPEESDHR